MLGVLGEAGSTHAGSRNRFQAQLFSPCAQPHQQQPSVPKAWLSPTGVCLSQARVEHLCPSIAGHPSGPQQECGAATAPSPSTHRPSCASTESSPLLSPWKWRRLEAGGEGRERVRRGAWSFSFPPFSFQLLRISRAPF